MGSSWDFNLESLDQPEDVLKNDDFQFVMKYLYGKDQFRWFVEDKEGILCLKLPLQYWLFKSYVEGPWSVAGIGVVLFPYSLFLSIIAFGIDFTKEADASIIIIVC